MVTRTPIWHFGQRCITLETWIGASRSRIPPWAFWPRGFVCRLMKLTFSTITRPLSSKTLSTFPVLPRSSPAITTTWSFLAKWDIVVTSDDFRRQRDDLHELPLAQLTRHGAEDARPLGLFLVVDQHRGILVEPDVGAVLPPHFLHGPDEDRVVVVTLLAAAARERLLAGYEVGVSGTAGTCQGAAEHFAAPCHLGFGVIRY